MQLTDARRVAEEIVAALAPSCARIEIAGSIRRQRPDVKDVEIAYVPHTEARVVDLFGGTEDIRLDEPAIGDLVETGLLAWDDQTKRRGPKYKRLVHPPTGLVVELFAAGAANWGLILALRTGPADFNHLLVTRRDWGGGMPVGLRMRDGYLWRSDGLGDGQAPISTPTEPAFFDAVGLPCWPPPERTEARLRDYLDGGPQ